MSDKPTNVLEALKAVSREVGRIEAVDTGQGISYKFRSIHRVLDVLHGPFLDNGILIVPSVKECRSVPHITTNAKGEQRLQLEAQILINYRVYGPGGPDDYLDMQVFTTSLDPGDKATGKAYSYGYKTVIAQLLTLSAMAEQDNDQASADAPTMTVDVSPGVVSVGGVAVHPQWPALSQRLQTLKKTDTVRYQDAIFYFMAKGYFTGDRKPNHPFNADQMNDMARVVDYAEGGFAPTEEDIRDRLAGPDHVPSIEDGDPMLDQAVGPPSVLAPSNVGDQPVRAHAHKILVNCLGDDYEDQYITPTMWALAEATNTDEIDWKQQARIFDWTMVKLHNRAKTLAQEYGHPKPPKLDSEEMFPIAGRLREDLLVDAYDKSKPF